MLNNNLKITVEIPKYSKTSGGIQRMKKLSEKLFEKKYKVNLRIQKENLQFNQEKQKFLIPYSLGLPDSTFPYSDIVITYSDNPYLEQLVNLKQVKKVLIYMLSYGMCIERERKNILNSKVVIMSSTNRTKELIEKENVKCNLVGFGFESKSFFCDYSILRKKYATLLCHNSDNKKFEFGVRVCDKLYNEGIIDGVIVFGSSESFQKNKLPQKIIEIYKDATQEQIRKVFNKSCIFIMPSISEGLNLTPIEATLCGCPSVICDGAIGDLFFNEETCLIAEKNNFEDFFEKSKKILEMPYFSYKFKKKLEEIIKDYTWEKTILNIESLFYK